MPWQALLASCLHHLEPHGKLLISASGASENVNPHYRQIYYQNLAVTEEYRTYCKKGPDGKVLYTTHHFEARELKGLLEEAGFVDVEIVTEAETHSSRPDQVANFLYATATAPASQMVRSDSYIPRSGSGRG